MTKLKSKRVLITGINGFIGSSLNNKLNKLGIETFGISRRKSKIKNILSASILDFEILNKFIKKNKKYL